MRYPLPTQREVPEIVNGYELDAARGWFYLIMPEASTNLCFNPSFETNTTYWSAGAGVLSRVSTYQRRGTYSGKYQPSSAVNDGCYYGATAASLIPTTAGQWYTASFDFKGAGGQAYQVYWADQWGSRLGNAKTFFASHDWSRITISWYEIQTTARRVYIAKNNSANIFPWYIDGMLIENKAYATTYFDGESVGYLAGVTDFWWNGARHASTSGRSASTRAGGKPMKLQDLGFVLLGILGLGMAPVQPLSQPYGWQHGSLYQRTRLPERDFTLAGYVAGTSRAQVNRTRAELESYLLPNTDEPLLLQYEYADECGTPTGEILNIPCSYAGGLEGKTDNLYGEKVAVKFIQWLPLIMRDGEEGASLSYQASLNAAYGAARIAGTWQALASPSFNSYVFSVRYDKTYGRIWYVGSFTTVGGLTVNRVTYYDIQLQTFVALGGGTKGVNNEAYSIVLMPNGDAWILGAFTACDGAVTNKICRWNNATNTFTAFNLAGTVTDFQSGAVDSDGNIYFAGNFTNWNGDAAQDYVTEYTAAGAWAAVGTSPFSANEYVSGRAAIVIDGSNNVYFGSDGTPGGVAAHLRKWNPTTTAWSDLGATAVSEYINALYIGKDGRMYIGGYYTSIAGIALQKVAIYNWVTFLPMGAGFPDGLLPASVRDVSGDNHGNIIVKGRFYLYGRTGTNFSYIAIWNNSTWIAPDIITPESSGAQSAARYMLDDLYLGWGLEASAISTVSVLNTITNTGSSDAYPVITFTGPGAVYWIKNETTGDLLTFNLVLMASEVAILNLSPSGVTFTSNFRGNILSTIMAGSNDATFRLVKGVNKISVLVAGTVTAATAVDMRWTPQYLALEH